MDRKAILDEAINAIQELKHRSSKLECCGATTQDSFDHPPECCGDPDVFIDADLAIQAIEELK